MWWAQRGATVFTIEEDEEWFRLLKSKIPYNVDLRYAAANRQTRETGAVRELLDAFPGGLFDIIVVDGHLRREVTSLAFSYLAPNGALILDNAEGYGFYEEVAPRQCRRIDFYGFAPGVSKRHCTSLVYVDDCFLIDPAIPFANIEKS